MSATPALSVIVPAHNAGPVLETTVEQLTAALADIPGSEVIIIENGSTDGTWALAQELGAREWPTPVVVCQSAVGLGEAYREGIRRATGERLLLTADDLPFGMSDVEAWRLAGCPGGLVVGSKAHPGSTVPRAFVRRLMTLVFTTLRRGTLALHVGDTQGTVFVPTAWAREVLPRLREGGYLFSTELLYAAHLQGHPITEVPIVLRERDDDGGTRIKVSDILEMAFGLVKLRRRRGEFTRS
ncbi:Glycosyltransferase involved in cell wall bisynthesis [Austwickia chelonae]|uniref:Putative glycosyltransferase n=1 Tax=Austwickia chelonae NBRC 105200 TaxID=1184607 RepID=K6VP02_9MICO|nr:glycosyltransferase family 2 protein [Austwickia chelonae]GAB78459.1 putative glycosyltransferase [Austwickia chelonae NBRC 105200]SEW39783.1 Glycosyltransferase involved in cell wall bisynthesis [Austwickia chelonae]